MINQLMNKLYGYLEEIGIKHPIYVFAIIGIPWLWVIYRSDFKNWRTLDRYRQFNLFGVAFTMLALIFLSLLAMFGVF